MGFPIGSSSGPAGTTEREAVVASGPSTEAVSGLLAIGDMACLRLLAKGRDDVPFRGEECHYSLTGWPTSNLARAIRPPWNLTGRGSPSGASDKWLDDTLMTGEGVARPPPLPRAETRRATSPLAPVGAFGRRRRSILAPTQLDLRNHLINGEHLREHSFHHLQGRRLPPRGIRVVRRGAIA
jgi:hypothetical protein